MYLRVAVQFGHMNSPRIWRTIPDLEVTKNAGFKKTMEEKIIPSDQTDEKTARFECSYGEW